MIEKIAKILLIISLLISLMLIAKECFNFFNYLHS